MRASQKRASLEYENGKFIAEYESATEAGRLLGIPFQKINNYLRGITKFCRDFPNKKWVYKDGKPTRKIKTN